MILNWLQRTKPAAQAEATEETRPPDEATRALIEKIGQYGWYHRIEVAPGVYTEPAGGGFPELWEFILSSMAGVDFSGKRVLDVACRDGLFSFEAERRGAASVRGIDNDLSPGATEFLIPHFQSKVTMEELSLYELDPSKHGGNDLVLFFGVLYHLRYPFWGLKKVIDCLAEGGRLLVETGILVDTKGTRDTEFLFCPVGNSPYEPTSCTFFNERGLVTTLESLGLRRVGHQVLETSACPAKNGEFCVNRQYFEFQKEAIPRDRIGANLYWDGTHSYHSVEAKDDPGLKRG